MHARWPEVGVVDLTLLKEADYLTTVSHEFRVRLKKMVEMREKVETYNVSYFAQYTSCMDISISLLQSA
jgi:hypothetical protein